MPRILIADDNSNIQKMAALALKDAGVEVIAVGNGEAAVRKMPEIAPDLVLADIFMPVRNGYEVCDFVKRDPRYANTPVILLVGAFDPFDEQEAQRVQADGVLKKPFVPPDPLINMVKALLAKAAGDRLMAVTVPVAAGGAAAESETSTAASPHVSETSVPEFADAPPDEFTVPSSKPNFRDHENTAAFASLLESPAAEMEQSEPVVTAPRDPVLGEPAFWTEPVAEEEPEEPHAEESVTEHSWKGGEWEAAVKEPAPPLREFEPASEAGRVDAAGAEPPLQDGNSDLSEFVPSEAFVAQEASTTDPVPLPQTHAESAPWEAASLDASFSGESPATLSPTEMPPISPALIVSAAEQSENAPGEEEVAALDLAQAVPAQAEPTYAEPTHAPVDLALWAAPEPQAVSEREPEPVRNWPPAFVPAVAPSAETSAPVARSEPALQAVPAVAEPQAESAPAPAPSPSPELIEAMVQRVIQAMQPRIAEMVTREILRPLAENLVRRELEKK